MNKEELRKKSIEELKKEVSVLEADIADIYFEMRTGKLKDVRKPRLKRKELSLMKTIIHEKMKNEDNLSSEKNG